MFQNSLAYSASSGADDEAVLAASATANRHKVQIVHAENALNLSEEARQEPEITSRHPNHAGDHFREKLFIWECDAGRCPSAFQQMLKLR